MLAGALAGVFGTRTASAAEDDYTYDTRYAGYLGRGLIHDERFSGRELHYGIDVSAHQKEIDWKAVADSGCEFVFIRLGYRGYGTGVLVEDEFAELYQKLIAWLEPDPARLRRGLQFLESLAACADPASSELQPLLFSQKCDRLLNIRTKNG